MFGFWKEKIPAGCFLMDLFFVGCYVKEVSPREVAQAAKVPSAPVSRSLVGRCGQGAASIYLCSLG